MSWEVEKSVWWRAFKSMLQQQPQDCGLLMTEAPFNLPSIQASTMQVTHDYSTSAGCTAGAQNGCSTGYSLSAAAC